MMASSVGEDEANPSATMHEGGNRLAGKDTGRKQGSWGMRFAHGRTWRPARGRSARLSCSGWGRAGGRSGKLWGDQAQLGARIDGWHAHEQASLEKEASMAGELLCVSREEERKK
ncbi:hypothetical protein PR202_gb07646 [Eleusine coracana subsp. coracana]|uniref:Uncharacterized protein n=1 Tax=Eleusine coracana subsp. coracana TaxID=191504 RepID=A0AAV5ED33_ELECO|nr:hypothetical protein PR202_gb07646 [Eleusine coracana subsp. coracana]